MCLNVVEKLYRESNIKESYYIVDELKKNNHNSPVHKYFYFTVLKKKVRW